MYIRFMLWSSFLGQGPVSGFGCQVLGYHRHRVWINIEGGIHKDEFVAIVKVYLDLNDSLASQKEDLEVSRSLNP